jgi:hypothetical protein
MIALLGRIRSEYGTTREYALSAGVTAESLARLEARLLEPA